MCASTLAQLTKAAHKRLRPVALCGFYPYCIMLHSLHGVPCAQLTAHCEPTILFHVRRVSPATWIYSQGMHVMLWSTLSATLRTLTPAIFYGVLRTHSKTCARREAVASILALKITGRLRSNMASIVIHPQASAASCLTARTATPPASSAQAAQRSA